ncbi:MAG: ribokinase [Rhizobiaceae bacterium]
MDDQSRLNVQFDVVVCGSLHLDIVVHAPALPKLDETAVGSAWEKVCGGKGGNQAVQAARAGAKTAMIGQIGKDDFGQTLLANLQASGVDVSAVSTDAAHGSGMSVAILQDNGDYGAVIVSGANLAIEAGQLEPIWRGLGGAKVLVLQNEVPHAVNVAAALAARRAGAKVVLNAAPARPLDSDLLDAIDVLIVNRVEADDMSGLPVIDQPSAIAALQCLAGGRRSVVITLGGGGLVVGVPSGDPVRIAALPVTVTSTHGAGDCFVGVLAAQLAAGASLIDACQFANRAAAAYVSRPQT